VISIVIGGAAYVVSHSLPATYSASGSILVTAASQQGLSDPLVLGTNDLSSQYAQLAGSQPVQALAAQSLDVAPSSLSFTGSTVSAQNQVQVTATASTAAAAERRAKAGTAALLRYLSGTDKSAAAIYLRRVQGGITTITRQINQIQRSLQSDTLSQHSIDAQLIVSLSGQRASLEGEAARDAASDRPLLSILNTATSASQTAPKPSLYAIVAFAVALIITVRLAYMVGRREAPPPPDVAAAEPA
jgi:capsular polysaccharide biosynthesis protein